MRKSGECFRLPRRLEVENERTCARGKSVVLAVEVGPRPRLLRLGHLPCWLLLSGYGARRSFGSSVAVGQDGFWSDRRNLALPKRVRSHPSKFLAVSVHPTSGRSRPFTPESRKKNGRRVSRTGNRRVRVSAPNESPKVLEATTGLMKRRI